MQKCEGTPFRRREQSVHRPWGRMVSGVYSRNPGRPVWLEQKAGERLDEEDRPTCSGPPWLLRSTLI